MRLSSCVMRDDKMDLEGPHTYCMFISIGILPPKDDELGRAQYDEQGVHVEHDTMGFG